MTPPPMFLHSSKQLQTAFPFRGDRWAQKQLQAIRDANNLARAAPVPIALVADHFGYELPLFLEALGYRSEKVAHRA